MFKPSGRTKISLALTAILSTSYAVAAEPQSFAQKEKERLKSIAVEQQYPDIQKAIDNLVKQDSFKQDSVKVGTQSLYRKKDISNSNARVYVSDDKKSKIILKNKDGITYGSAVVAGESYSIFNGQIQKFDNPHSHEDDVVIDNSNKKNQAIERSRKGRIEDAKRMERLKRSIIGEGSFVANSSVSVNSNNNSLKVIIDGVRHTLSPFYTEKYLDELTAQELFTSEKISEVMSRASTLSSYAQSSMRGAVEVDHVITTGAVLEEYKDWGVLGLEFIKGQIDSKIEGANVILYNSFLGDMKFENSTTTLVSEYTDFAVGNTVVERYLSGQERILYAAVDMKSQLWDGRGEGICGFASLPQILKMENPDSRTIGDMGTRSITTLGRLDQSWNMHGVSRTGCLDSRVFLHEIGHSNGLEHDRANSNRAGDYEFNYGFSSSEEGKYSVMGYSCSDCFYEPLISSPDNYDFILGVDPYAIDGADAHTFLNTSFWLKYMPIEKQTQYMKPVSSTLENNFNSWATSQTFEWDVPQGAEVQTLVVRDWSNNAYYMHPLPLGTDSFTFEVDSLPTFGLDGYIVSGFVVGDAVQPITTRSFSIDTTPAQKETEFRSPYEVTTSTHPDVIEKGGVYELSFTVSEKDRQRLQQRYDDPSYSEWGLLADVLYEFRNDFGLPAEDVITITNSLEDVIATGRINATLTMPTGVEKEKMLRILGDSSSSLNEFYTFSLSIEATLTDSFGNEARYSHISGTFDLKSDPDSFLPAIKVTANELLIPYRKEDATQIPVTFTFEGDSDVHYEITEGYTDTGISANSIANISLVDNGDSSKTLTVLIEPSQISQTQDEGYFLTVSTFDSIPATATTLLKDNDVPYFGANEVIFVATDEDFEFTIVAEDLLADTDYALDLVSFSEDFNQLVDLASEYTVEAIDSTSKRFAINASLASALSDNYAVRVYPVDENANPTGREASLLSHRFDFAIEFNKAPTIECIIEGESVIQPVCEFPVYSSGETPFNSLLIYDVNSRDTLTYDWDFSGFLFQTFFTGENNNQLNIVFPETVDQDWKETRFSVNVSDGSETSNLEAVLVNPYYVVNVAPSISCASSANCRYTLQGVGEYTFTSFSVVDEGEDDPIQYTWTSTGSPFDVNQVGNEPVISFPAEADTTWQSFTLTLTASDGDLQDTQSFTIVNANYDSGAGGGTGGVTPAPSSGESSGGSMGFGVLLLGLVAYLRRKV